MKKALGLALAITFFVVGQGGGVPAWADSLGTTSTAITIQDSNQVVELSGFTALDALGSSLAEDNSDESGFKIVKSPFKSGQALIVLNGPKSPTEFSFSVKAVSDAKITLVSAVNVVGVYENQTLIGAISEPWAYDALGNQLQTQFVVEGNTIRQLIDISAAQAFPVVADPSLVTLNLCLVGALAWVASTGATLGLSSIIGLGLAGADCAANIISDNLTKSDYQSQVSANEMRIATLRSQNSALLSENRDLTNIANNPNASASSKNAARARIAANLATVAANNDSIAYLQSQNQQLNNKIAELSFW
jgi:hypothetical protein